MNHLLEWSESRVDEELTRLNVVPLNGTLPYDYLFYSEDLPRRNDGRLRDSVLKRYRHIEEGGWWCSGIDLLTGKDDLWGCFKPNQPRDRFDGTLEGNLDAAARKPIKYEHPPKTATGLFALRVPLHLWKAIADRAGVGLSHDDIDNAQSDFGFWQWLLNHPEVPLCVTEGAKKAGALLSAGYAAVALPGIHGGYRVPRDEWGNRVGKSRLIPQLSMLAEGKRPVYLVFDRDRKPSAVKAVQGAIRRTGYLLSQAGCPVRVVTWNPEAGKGVDDFIANRGTEAFDGAYSSALPLTTWRARSLTRLTYSSDIQLNQPFLGDLPVPKSASLVGIRSPKGTGKTEFLRRVVERAIEQKQRVLVIGHRVQLVEALCQRFGLPYISQVSDPSDPGIGYGLCIDSLHPDSQAQFDPEDWTNAVVILDEVEQVLWHGLNSDTCRSHRVPILRSLKSLVQNTIAESGQVFAADADLSDTSLDYLLSLASVKRAPFIVQNEWKAGKDAGWTVHHYTESTPKRIVRELEQHIEEGGKPFVCLSAQKLTSPWSTRSLEAYFRKKFPNLKILRVDAESVSEPSHPSYRCMGSLDRLLKDYDVVLASPSIETGVSIDLQGHFTSVWAIAQGVQSENSVRQAIARVRDTVPRHLWLARYGFNKVGNGSTSIPSLLSSGKRLTQLNVRLLQQSDFEAFDDFDAGFQAESLMCWAKMAVRLNATMAQYRDSAIAALRDEGHEIVEIAPAKKTRRRRSTRKRKANDTTPETPSETLQRQIAEVQRQNYEADCQAIAESSELNDLDYRSLKKTLVKTPNDRRALRKYELHRRYKISVTPELVQRDDKGWYKKLRLHYFLTVGRSYLAERDRRVAQKLIERGQGQVFQPDFNRSQLGATVGTMEILGIAKILNQPQRELRNTDEDLQAMAKLALQHRADIKLTTGIGLAKNSTPMVIVRRFLDKLGYALTCLRCEREKNKKPLRVYRIEPPQDDRWLVFEQWLAVDRSSKRFRNRPKSRRGKRQEPEVANLPATPEERSEQLALELD
ncbi:plasmid replication protein, CyRepA1 family [Baaleninema sp.]|uniref:plasmid replication protein, CyRepA1 family n=1 Tax=Baaleninema sp. TaxID=3101197 RepID=UPI003D02D166